jgi:p-aminobenzoyl-glutamate transporter AbgT
VVDCVNSITKTFAGLSGLIFPLFVISQFLAYFAYSNIATIVAADLGEALEHAYWGKRGFFRAFAPRNLARPNESLSRSCLAER